MVLLRVYTIIEEQHRTTIAVANLLSHPCHLLHCTRTLCHFVATWWTWEPKPWAQSHEFANYESEWWAFGSRYRPCSTSPRFSQQHPRGGSSSWNRDGQEFGQHLFAALTADPRTRFPNTTVIPPHPDASLVGPGKSGHRHQWQRGWAVHFSIAKAGVSNMFFSQPKGSKRDI